MSGHRGEVCRPGERHARGGESIFPSMKSIDVMCWAHAQKGTFSSLDAARAFSTSLFRICGPLHYLAKKGELEKVRRGNAGLLALWRVSDKHEPKPYLYPLWEHMAHNHGLVLLESELYDIIMAVKECSDTVKEQKQ